MDESYEGAASEGVAGDTDSGVVDVLNETCREAQVSMTPDESSGSSTSSERSEEVIDTTAN
jgi:hypothetical protein